MRRKKKREREKKGKTYKITFADDHLVDLLSLYNKCEINQTLTL